MLAKLHMPHNDESILDTLVYALLLTYVAYPLLSLLRIRLFPLGKIRSSIMLQPRNIPEITIMHLCLLYLAISAWDGENELSHQLRTHTSHYQGPICLAIVANAALGIEKWFYEGSATVQKRLREGVVRAWLRDECGYTRVQVQCVLKGPCREGVNVGLGLEVERWGDVGAINRGGGVDVRGWRGWGDGDGLRVEG